MFRRISSVGSPLCSLAWACLSWTCLAWTCLTWPAIALGQEDDEDEEASLTDFVGTEVERVEGAQGFGGTLSLGGTVHMVSNQSVVGQNNGLTALLGMLVEYDLSYIDDQFEWTSSLYLSEAWSRTPGVNRFFKSDDEASVESLFNYFVWPGGGMFARASFATTLFDTKQVTPEEQTYYLDGDEDESPVATTDNFALARALEPLSVEESVGLFLKTADQESFTATMRAGFGGRHTLAKNVRVITDDFDPDNVLFEELSDVHQGGVEAFVGAQGSAKEGQVSYELGISGLWPILNNDPEERSSIELTKISFQAGALVEIFSWLRLNYRLVVARDKQLIDALQVQHKLLFDLGLTVQHGAQPTDEEEDE
ncbi:MAG: hypothetical protein OXR73_24910 [Myxococcales bacterium]|nr:hypothetical protein [Myxococcales bacterium]